jgi:hypothetical protein
MVQLFHETGFAEVVAEPQSLGIVTSYYAEVASEGGGGVKRAGGPGGKDG